MTHTVHPYAHRLGVLRNWKSRWFSATPAEYRKNLGTDLALRKFLKKRLRGLYVTAVEIERSQKALRVLIKTSRPGLVIGRGGEGSQKLAKEIEEVVKLQKPAAMPQVKIDIEEVRSPESQAPIVAYMVAEGLEKRQTFRRVMKQTVEKVMANRDVQGVAIGMSGRLGGAEMSRDEYIKMGRIPLQTLRADIDFAREEAYLPYGVIGIKVWIYRGDVFESTKREQEVERARRDERSRRA